MDVIKYLRVEKNDRGTGYIFKSNDKRIYFLDRKEENSHLLKPRRTILGWVTKEMENSGFVRISVGGMLIRDYIDNTKTLELEDYSKLLTGYIKDEHFLVNFMYNSDTEFKEYLKQNAKQTTSISYKDKIEKCIAAKIKSGGCDEKLAEIVVKKPFLDWYLFNKFIKGTIKVKDPGNNIRDIIKSVLTNINNVVYDTPITLLLSIRNVNYECVDGNTFDLSAFSNGVYLCNIGILTAYNSGAYSYKSIHNFNNTIAIIKNAIERNKQLKEQKAK